MKDFRINHTDVQEYCAYVEKNPFIGRAEEDSALPLYEDIKEQLPKPFWTKHDDYIKCYDKTWELAFKNLRKANFKGEAGFVSNFIDTAFNGQLFMWDSVFILMFGKYASHIFDFQKTLDNFYAHQYKDGYICRQIREDIFADRWSKDDPCSTGPNLLAWSEWENYLITGDKNRLKEVFYPILGYHRWLMRNRTWKDGGYWSCGYACGFDKQPRQPKGYTPSCSHGFMTWVDATTQMLMSDEYLLKIAKEIGNDEDLTFLEDEYNNLAKIINKEMWDKKTNFYYDVLRNGRISGYKTLMGYWPLLTDIIPKRRLKKFVAHLDNEKEFKRLNRIPSLPADNPDFDPNGAYQNGGVWAPTNYMVLKGLDKHGFYKLSHEIAFDYLKNVVEVFKKEGTVFENYSPDFIKNDSNVRDFVGWTGLAPISIFFEYVLGIKPKVNENEIEWHIELLEEHGIRNYRFGDAVVELKCLERKSKDIRPTIIIKSTKPVTIKLFYDNKIEIVKA